jgi:DNA invertase Pin-like site-specific DNA recombinase
LQFGCGIVTYKPTDACDRTTTMQAKMGRFTAYFRVSTARQGRSGLGLEAQQEAVRQYLASVGGTLVAEFTEVESGKRNARPELEKALAACKRHKCKLVIAKIDRLSRNLAFIAKLMDGKIEFVACDNPVATRLTLHILAAVAEHEREAISQRTAGALQAAKRRGVVLGRNGAEVLAPANRAAAMERARLLKPILSELTGAGMSIRQIAVELMARRIPTAGGGNWHPQTVSRVLERVLPQRSVPYRRQP